MNQSPEQLRVLAAAARTCANGEALENARSKHLAAAEMWDQLAERAEAIQENRRRRAEL